MLRALQSSDAQIVDQVARARVCRHVPLCWASHHDAANNSRSANHPAGGAAYLPTYLIQPTYTFPLPALDPRCAVQVLFGGRGRVIFRGAGGLWDGWWQGGLGGWWCAGRRE